MLDNRLDFISDIQPGAIEKMKEIREMFIALDKIITIQGEKCQSENIAAGVRTASLSRTHLETSLQFAIKTLCLLGETKKDH